MGLGVLLGLTGSVLINVGNNVQALGCYSHDHGSYTLYSHGTCYSHP